MRLLRTIVLVLLAPVYLGTLPATAIEDQDRAGAPSRRAIEFFDVPDMPVIIGHATLSKTADNYIVECSMTNRVEEELRGFGLLIWVTDAYGAPRQRLSWMVAGRLKSFAIKEFTIRLSPKLKLTLNEGDRVLVATEQVIGESSIWNVLKPEDALRSYAAGDNYAPPRVVRVSNNLDSLPGGF